MHSPKPTPKPLVLIPSCNRWLGQLHFHVAGNKYVEAVRLAGCLALVVPCTDLADLEALLEVANGVLLTGSPANVHPRHFGEAVHDLELPLDPMRDDWTLPLIPRALAKGIPMFAICRGFQEVNVALGGSLHQAVQEVPGQMDHRSDDAAEPEVQYGPAHEVSVLPGGQLATLLGGVDRIEVNSAHGQGVNRLATGLRVEAVAPDGLIEAFSVSSSPGFNLCVQWHPEWQAQRNPVSMKLFSAFGAACAMHQKNTAQAQRKHD